MREGLRPRARPPRLLSIAAALVALLAALLPARLPAQVEKGWKFSGTVEIDSTQVAFIASGNLGAGVLEFEGEEHHFSVAGLGIGAIGIQRINAVGAVYNLPDVSRFPGTYVQARVAATLGSGRGTMRLSNEHGVILDLRMSSSGIALSVGADGMLVTMDRPR